MSKVKVVADENQNVLFISENNPEYGWLFVEQVATQIENGWLRNVRRKARIMGKVSDLQELGYTAEAELPGKIIVKESFTPFNLENPDRDLKIAGSTGIICRLDDQPIYRQTFYTTNESLQDELISHNNNLEIKEVMNAQKSFNLLNIKKVSETTEL